MRTGSVNGRQTAKLPRAWAEAGTCDVADEDLVAYADGDLRGARGEWVEAHLAVCAHCKQQYAAFAAVDAILRHAPPPADAPDRGAWMRAYIQREATHRLPWHRFRWWPRPYQSRRPRAFLVALGLKVVLLVLVLWPGLAWERTNLRVPLVLATVAVLVSLVPLRERMPE